MTKAESRLLEIGLYRINWFDGYSSLAAIGMKENGDRWIAPTNWVYPSIDNRCWRLIKSVEKIRGWI